MIASDVIVVGAGPSGALTALLLARAGVSVILMDRSVFPRAKPCGDCLSVEANRLLERHGLLDAIEARPHARLRGWRVFAPAGHSFEADFSDVACKNSLLADRGAIAIERFVLDDILVRAAADAGAVLMQSTRAVSLVMHDDAVCGVRTADGRALHARHIVGADGLRSLVARRLDAVKRRARVRKVSLTVHVDALLQCDSYGEMHMGDGVCAGIAPVNHACDRWNLTVVADADRFGRDVAEDAGAFFKRVLQSMHGTRDRFTSLALNNALADVLASGPFDVPTRRVAFPGASLVGDAAGYFDPFTGQGVYHALRAAELLAETLVAELQDASRVRAPEVLHAYARRAAALSRGPRRLQRVIDGVLSRPRLADRAIARIARAPEAARALLDVTGDTAPIASLFSKSVARSILAARRQ